MLICIGTGKTVDDEERLKIGTDQLFFKSGEQMAALFPHVPEAILNTGAIAGKCNLELTFGAIFCRNIPRCRKGWMRQLICVSCAAAGWRSVMRIHRCGPRRSKGNSREPARL